MATVTVKIKATANANVSAWWVAINDTDLEFHQGSAEAELEAPAEHLLYYWIKGAPGGKLDVVVKQGAVELRKVSDTIPAGYFQAGNARFFKTN